MVHADPPYGMGKESDGVLNDNIYRERLDEFQMEWWTACRPSLDFNASAYIWGTAPDLWRLWYAGGLRDSEHIEIRNEIVWSKPGCHGLRMAGRTQYSTASERCLFMQIGEQFIGNLNADEYWDGWDEIRVYLRDEARAAGLTDSGCKEITGVGMFSHWFSRSQWCFIPADHYATLQAAFPGYFVQPHDNLRATYARLRVGFESHIGGILGGMRSYFDNTHDIMPDIWEFRRVVGDERYGHPTPKPVDMMARAIKTSAPEGGRVLVPFAGTFPEIIAAERTGRRAFGLEIDASYCDIAIQRWEAYTGREAVRIEDA